MNAAVPVSMASAMVSPRISEFELRAWVVQARPGDVLEYHRGFLAIDRTPLGPPMSDEERSALAQTGAVAMRLASEGGVHLVQRRLGPGSCSYLAIARRRPRSSPAGSVAVPRDAGAVPLETAA
ncbi:MAG: hypothetical protein KDJ41_13845 [Hyphomicrobiaceae bacterium]|nr:hypothetical protein [Bauldia sp.]MCB1548898.1 hypothetical protein [Hyphomicrobiaceae bacterium]